ncbi:IclR family transcriptional regulator [Lutibaculum baratangense]|uniref:Transcriptional regulator, IclR family n=1 Tax=Lutibaculum baratangense AMV1 TaxID=631454 RepID=V4TNX4_9HYPH|nr:IclR family transcriptional regulator C-terminal domain-containing protein [Lutibaculum baratangense]ESR27373.1 Transcriptional regulator, IclR family [Lutibaculum baratangense AMV1]
MGGRGSERILDLIEWLAERTAPTGLSDAAQALEIPKSSALLLLRTLVARGYVAREGSGYRLVTLPGEHAHGGVLGWGTLLRLAEPFLETAVREAEESGFIAVLTPERRVHYLTKKLPQREIRYDRDISRDRIAHHVASGLVLLCDLPDDELEAHLAACEENEAERDAARERILQARREGYAVNLIGRIEGAGGVAAPIIGGDGRIVAAVNISGPKDRFSEHLDRSVSAVVEAARRASQELARRHATQKTALGGTS